MHRPSCIIDAVRRLSPLNPAQFSINSSFAVSLVHQGKYKEAAALILRVADNPRAYIRIFVLAAVCLELAGYRDGAQRYMAKVLKLEPDYSVEIFQRILSHREASTRNLFARAMLGAGLPMVSATNK